MIIRPGRPCSCSPHRYVRWAVPTVPGLVGEVSCRTIDSTGWADVRRHPLPPQAVIEVFTSNPGR